MAQQTVITTVTELKTSLSNWLNRTDQSARYDEFIVLAESEIRRVLRTKYTSTVEITTVAADGDYTITSFDEMAEIKEIYITAPTDSAGTVDLVSAGLLYNNRRLTRAENKRPQLVAIQGSTLLVSPLPDQAYTIVMEIEGKLTPLSTASSNYVLLAYPDVYLYGSLMHAAPYLENDERVPLWKGFFDQAIEQLRQDQIRNEFPARLNAKVPTNLAPIHTQVGR